MVEAFKTLGKWLVIRVEFVAGHFAVAGTQKGVGKCSVGPSLITSYSSYRSWHLLRRSWRVTVVVFRIAFFLF